ncbi:hypothetical protein [Bilifractor porci]|uniref:Gram-positive cocci surface proteins LPxTG domain-containing protein n=1 Tax=Bilifractor porci TaxID=2606636 RepID=A0A7X2P788_9FIRM|nr:hypothetical protein [Bilifractor porci]MST81111.1 hypothetical protein [Bilifractor porci]
MKNSIEEKAKKAAVGNRQRKKRRRFTSLLCVFVLAATTVGLVLPANTATAAVICGKEEHTHTDACYKVEKKLVCTKEEHTHTADCYDENGNLICGKKEHTHSEGEPCYEEVKTLTCGKEEHVHSESCYEQAGKLSASASDGMTAETAYDAGVLHNGTVMKAQLLTGADAQAVQAQIQSALDQEKSGKQVAAFYPYDLSFADKNGQKTEPDGKVDVTLTFPQPKSAGTEEVTWKLYHIADGQTAEDMGSAGMKADLNISVENHAVTKAAFRASSFSPYVLAALSDKTEEADAVSTEKVSAASNSQKSAENTQTTGNSPSEAESSASSESTAEKETIEEGRGTENTDAESASTEGDSAPADVKKISGFRALRAPASQSVDFAPYISSVTVKKNENGQWTASDTFQDGDQVKIDISYEIPKSTLQSSDDTIYYQLPDGVRPLMAETGRVTIGDNEVGDYTIGTDGKITIKYDPDFTYTDHIIGSITFKGTVTNTGSDNPGTISFGGKGGSIKVYKPVVDNHDISVKKTGSVNDSRTEASYEVTVSTEKGTGEKVTVSDQYQKDNSSSGAVFQYKQDSLKVYCVGTDGSKNEVSGYSLSWTTDSAGTPGFTITDLPALEAGQKYVVDYKAAVSGTAAGQDGKLANNASAASGNHKEWGWNSVSWEKDLKKTGTYDKTTGKISWRITVNPSGKDISGWKIEDTLPYSLYGQYTVWNEANTYKVSGGQTGDKKLLFTFPEDLTDSQKKDKYYIDYWTDAPADNSEVSNKAKVTEKDETTVTDTDVVPVEHRTFDVKKHFSSETQTESEPYKLTWNAEVTTPDTALGTFTYTDTIENAVNSEGKDQGADSHYGIASEIDAALTEHLKLMVDNYSWYEYKGAGEKTYWHSYYEKESGYTDKVSITVTYYDANGNVITSTDAASHVKSFRVTVTPKEGISMLAQKLTLENYPTYLNMKDAAEGVTWTAKNKGVTGDHLSEASHDHTKPKTFEKMVYTGKGITYSSGDVQVAYEDVKGVLTYRLMLNTKESDEGIITIKDHIPAGESYVEGSGYAKFYKNDYDQHDSNYAGCTFSKGTNPAFHAVKNTDGSTDLTITISDYKYISGYPMVAVYYSASVADDLHWQNAAAPGKTYGNTATWGNHTSTQNTTVTRQVKKLDKQGVQLDKKGKPLEIGTDGNPVSGSEPSGTIRYDIAINPAAEDLDPNSDNLTLVDFLSSNAAAFHPALDLNKVKLYFYDGTAEDHKGSLIDPNRYKIMYDQTSLKMTLVLPDKVGAVLEYEYVLDGDFTDKFQLDNTATLKGTWDSENKTALRETSSSATVTTRKVVIYKVDSNDYKKILPGTKFKLDYWNSSAKEWKVKNSELTVGNSGTIVFDIGEGDLDLSTIYRLKETEALEGYRNGTDDPDVVRYFVVMPEKSSDGKAATKDTTYNDMGGYNTFENGAKVPMSEVTFFQNSGGVMYVPNEYRAIRVQKVWLNADNTDLTDPGKTAVVHLYRASGSYNSCKVTVVVSDSSSRTGTYQVEAEPGTIVSMKIYYNGVWLYYDGHQLTRQWDSSVGMNYYPIDLGTVSSDQTINVLADYELNMKTVQFDYTKPTTFVRAEEKLLDTQTLSSSNNWQYVWDGTTMDADGNTVKIPESDGNGNIYYYYIKEDPVSGFTTTYSENNTTGIQTGVITVTNKKDKTNGYVLPSTGGGGTFRFAGPGLALLSVSALGFLTRKRRRRGG